MQAFLSITVLIFLAAISPGPDFAMVTKNSLLYSRKHGIYSALGIAMSLLLHTIYCVLGLAVIISQSLLAFTIIKYLGAAYLTYIGIKSLLAKREQLTVDIQQTQKKITHAQSFYQGLLGNLLNPKAIMFLLVFFTLVVTPGTSIWVEMAYGIEIAAIHMLWFATLAFLLTHHYVKVHLNKIQVYIVKIMGVVLVAFGIRIASLHQVALLPATVME